MSTWGDAYAGGSRTDEFAKAEGSKQRTAALGLGVGGLAAMRVGAEREVRTGLGIRSAQLNAAEARLRHAGAVQTAAAMRGKTGKRIVNPATGRVSQHRFGATMANAAVPNAVAGVKAAEHKANVVERQGRLRIAGARRLRVKGVLAVGAGGLLAANSLRRKNTSSDAAYGGYPYA